MHDTDADLSGLFDEEAAAPPRPATAPGPELFLSGATFVLDAPREIPAVWGKEGSVLWAAGEALMVVGPNGVGKTTLAHQLVAGRLGIRDNVLGMPIAPGAGRLLYLACDRPRQIARAMQRLFTEEHRDVLQERLVVWAGPPPHDFAKRPEILMQMCVAAGADTVVVDSVKDTAIGLSEDAVGAAYNRARQAAIKEGVEVLELHHQKKAGAGGGKPNTLADVYGSVWITAGAGSVVLLWGEAGDPVVEMRHLKQPADEVGPFQVLHDHDTGVTGIVESTDLLAMAKFFPHGMTAQTAARQMYENVNPTKPQVEKARRQLNRLVKAGLMVAREGAAGGANGSEPTKYFLVSHQEAPS
jgi:hypothetical protein